ncbi:MAG: radical SAM family heme chaperone HemW [Thiotrichaceae bacterium]
MTPVPLSLYIHFPWCLHKCPYCDFNSHQVPEALPEERYIQALLRDLEQELPSIWGRPLHTVFMGGGTPSLISAKGMRALMQGLNALLPMRPNMEITLEANPGTFEQQRFDDYREAGITRLSIGIQSYDAKHLQVLERVHDAEEAHQAAKIAKTAGFDNFNLDLMFGLPKQTLEQALTDLQLAIEHQPPHLSWYQLTLEPNTLFHHQPPQLPDPDLIADIQDAGVELLEKEGYEQYEVSAYAQPKKQCMHNRNYWEFGDYIGIGAGAHGKITTGEHIVRTMKAKHPEKYMDDCLGSLSGERSSQSLRVTETELYSKDRSFEFMLNGLRLKEGIEKELFTQRALLPLDHLRGGADKAKAKELLIETDTHFKLTSRGWHFLNEAVECFLY